MAVLGLFAENETDAFTPVGSPSKSDLKKNSEVVE